MWGLHATRSLSTLPAESTRPARVQSPDPASWAAERRACDGCPRRSVGHAFLDATVINVFYELANLARGQVTARITPKTWWANMEQGWVWDLDDFLVNQIGHPYQGNNYFNAGRANGLSFWESAGITAFGSGTWEYFGETNHASLNDLVNTTLGGIALGEMFHRAAWLVRDTRATGRGRLMKEIAATAIDPVTGVKRFLSGDSSRVSEKPAEMVPSSLGGMVSAGVLWRGSNTSAFDSAGKPFLELDLLYGDPTNGRSRTPYDAFGVLLRFGGGGAFSEAKVRGRLLGQPFQSDRFQLNVSQAYDFSKNTAYQFGAQSFNVNAAYTGKLSSRMSIWVVRLGRPDRPGRRGFDSADRSPARRGRRRRGESPGQGVSEGPRFYDYGPGSNFGASAVLARDGRPIAALRVRNPSSLQPRWCSSQPLPAATEVGPAGASARTARHRRLRRVLRSPDLLQGRRERDEEVPFPPGPRVPDMEGVVSRRTPGIVAVVVAIACFTPVVASAQTTPPAAPAASVNPADQSRMWIVVGGTSTTLRGDCQEDCVAHGTGAYLHTGSVLAVVGFRVNRQMDAGVEVSWVPATSKAGDDIRSTFLLAAAQFKPWESRGFFLKAGMGMAFVRNFVYDGTGTLPPITSKALGLTYGAGWTFRHTDRLGLQIFGAQHVAALGDFQTGGVTVENVVGNFWSVGAAIVIR